MGLKIVHIICENGLGHFKRAIGLLDQFLKKIPDAQIDIVCSEQQIAKIQGWEKANILNLPNCNTHTQIASPGVHWFNDETHYQENRLLKWSEKLKNFQPLFDADLVVSDNLVAPLQYRPDTLLMGGFLWLDVFEKSNFRSQPVLDFIDEQKRILIKSQPKMICVEDVAMDVLSKFTQPIKMPWFGQVEKQERDKTKRTNKIAVLGGATATINSIMNATIASIIEKTEFTVITPQRTIDQLSEISTERIQPFNFEIEDFQNCDLVICRPGVGTITDCITTHTPMMFIYEKDNAEMSFNAQQLAKKEIAFDLGNDFNEITLIEKINHIYNKSNYESIIEALKPIATNGFEVAVDWIINNYLDLKKINYADESNHQSNLFFS